MNDDGSVVTRTILEPTYYNDNHMAKDDCYNIETITKFFKRLNLTVNANLELPVRP